MVPKLSTFVEEAPEMRSLSVSLGRLQKLQHLYAKLVPKALSDTTEIGFIDKDCLVLFAYHGTAAASLRQRITSILEEIQKIEPQISKIKIEVKIQKPLLAELKTATPTRELPSIAVDNFSELANSLDDSPLKNAIRKLLKEAKLK